MSDHIRDTHEMVKGYVEARVTRTEEIRARVEKRIPKFIVPDDVTHLLTELTALREEVKRLRGALEYGFRLVNDRKGEGDFSPAKFVAMAREALSSSPAQRESDHAGL